MYFMEQHLFITRTGISNISWSTISGYRKKKKNIYKAPSIQIYPFGGTVHEYIIQVLQNYNIKVAKVNKMPKISIKSNK